MPSFPYRTMPRSAALLLPQQCALLAALAILLPTGATAQPSASSPPRMGTWYTVTIPPHDRRLARIEARIELADSVLMMYPDGAGHLRDGWATYLRSLSATTDAGNPVRLRPAGRDRWIVPAPRPAALRLQYEVLLHHDAGDWPLGPKDAAFVTTDGIFVTGRALFIAQRDMRPATVRVVLPPRWRFVTPWQVVPGDSSSYRVPAFGELLQVGMFAGRPQMRRLLLDGATVLLASSESLPGAADLLAETLGTAIRGADALFGGTPRGTFVAVAHGDRYQGGTAFVRSFSVVLNAAPTRANRDEWGHLLVHELLHLWLGGAIRTFEGSQEQWFLEGGNDYLATLVQLRTGLITREQFYARVARSWDRYRGTSRALSLRAAGEDRIANRDAIYAGGLLAMFTLDTELRHVTGGRAGVDSLVQRLFALHGRTSEPIAYTSIRREARRLGGPTMDTLFARFIDGVEPIPLERTLALLGHTLQTGTTPEAPSQIVIATEQTPTQQGLERGLVRARAP